MAVLRAVAQFDHVSGLARDRAINTFHFNGEADAPTMTTIADAVKAFYLTNPVDPAAPIGKWLSSILTGLIVKVYDVTDEPAGPPLLVTASSALPARHNVVNLPAEVAVCLSFEGTPAAGLVQSRRRGRIYVGPLNLNASEQAASAVAKPLPLFNTLLRVQADRLAADVDAVAEWVIYSRPFAGRPETPRPGRTTLPALPARPGTTVNIDRVWTDDAFDTQRRRGERPTLKTFESVV